MERINWKESAAITVTVAGALLAAYLLGRYLLVLFLPFLLAFALALITRPLVVFFAGRGCPERLAAGLVTLLALLGLGILGYFLCSRLLLEVRELILFLAEDSADPTGKLASFFGFFKNIGDRLPFIARLREANFLKLFIDDPEGFVSEQLKNGLARLSERVSAVVVGLVTALPSVVLFLLVTLIACFYFAVEYKSIGRAMSALVSNGLRARLPDRFRQSDWRDGAGRAIRRYIRAYFLLFLLTAGELLIGFLILSVDYAVLFAILTALLDILPVLGVGTVLIPYAVVAFVTGDVFLGVGLLILYGVMTVVRQIVEPHLVGKSLGLHPVVMLIAFYAGWKLFGVAGVFAGPILAMLIKAALAPIGQEENKKTHSWGHLP